MAITNVEVHGWKNSGPAYSVHHYLSGFANRRNRTPIDTHGQNKGRNTSEPGFHLAAVDGGTEWWIVNKGHVYKFTILVNGSEADHLFDARENYLVLKFGESLSVIEVLPVDPPVDDEDAVVDEEDVLEEE